MKSILLGFAFILGLSFSNSSCSNKDLLHISDSLYADTSKWTVIPMHLADSPYTKLTLSNIEIRKSLSLVILAVEKSDSTEIVHLENNKIQLIPMTNYDKEKEVVAVCFNDPQFRNWRKSAYLSRDMKPHFTIMLNLTKETVSNPCTVR